MRINQKCEAAVWKMRMMLKRQVSLAKVDKNMCDKHPEWTDLTKEEEGKINRWERYAHKCYKNIFGGVFRTVRF